MVRVRGRGMRMGVKRGAVTEATEEDGGIWLDSWRTRRRFWEDEAVCGATGGGVAWVPGV